MTVLSSNYFTLLDNNSVLCIRADAHILAAGPASVSSPSVVQHEVRTRGICYFVSDTVSVAGEMSVL